MSTRPTELARCLPADKAAWGAARQQWGGLKAIEKAAAPTSADAVAGNISPAKLSSALMTGNKNSMLYGTGNQELPDLARIGQAFIKDQIPDSGTSQRAFYQALMTGAPGAAGMLLANPLTAAAGMAAGSLTPAAVQAMMRSKGGQAYLSKGLLDSTPTNDALAHILRQATVGAGTKLSLPYGTQ